MSTRSGIYIVPTDRWYAERGVWVVAGVVLLVSTAAAALWNRWAILMVVATGLVSMSVAITGFCPVANVLKRLGCPGLLDSNPSSKWYVMKTDTWYLERRIYPIVGFNIAIASVLSLVHSPWWLIFPGFVGMAMFWFASTGFCILANAFYWSGAEPRLNPGAVQPRRASEIAAAPCCVTPGAESHAGV